MNKKIRNVFGKLILLGGILCLGLPMTGQVIKPDVSKLSPTVSRTTHLAGETAGKSQMLTPEADFAANYFENVQSRLVDAAGWIPAGENSRDLSVIGHYAVDDSQSSVQSVVAKAEGLPAFEGGTYRSIDYSVLGNYLTYEISVTKADKDNFGDPVENGWNVTNMYGLETSLFATYDASTGVLSFPSGQEIYPKQQLIFVKLLIDSSTGRITVRKRDAIKGQLNSDGSITLEPWGIVQYKEDGGATAYNLFTTSRLVKPNATFTGRSLSTETDETRPAYIEQMNSNEVMICGITGLNGDVIIARPTPMETLSISPQMVTTNSLYGDFFIYNLVDVTKGTIDRVNPLILPKSSNGWSLPNFAIATRTDDNGKRLLDAYSGGTLTSAVNIKYPETAQINFEGQGTQTDPYQIKKAEDMFNLSRLLEQGMTFAGKYLSLENDINFSNYAPGEYIPIGDATNKFAGNFNGKGHTLIGIKLEGRGYPYVGVFGYLDANGVVTGLKINGLGVQASGDNVGSIVGMNDGLIEKCEVLNTQLFTTGAMTGGIAGGSSGIIRDCSFMGNVYGIGSQGGIVGQGINEISNCQVRGNIKIQGFYTTKGRDCGGIAGVFSAGTMNDCTATGMISDTYGRGALGGLIGRTLYNAEVNRCFTAMSISGKMLSADATSYAGGLTGMCYTAKYTDCLASGTILENDANNNVGGLIGNLSVSYTTSGYITTLTNRSEIKNCMFTGQLISGGDGALRGMFGTTFYHDNNENLLVEDACLSNCYYDQQVNTFSDSKFGRNTEFFLSKLPEGYDVNVWQSTTNGYPVIKKFGTTEYSNLAASAPILAKGQTATKVKGQFELSTIGSTNWDILTSEGDADYAKETSELKITGNTAIIKDKYANVMIAGHSADGWGIKMYRLSIVPKLFDGEGTEESPYLIKTVSDVAILDNAVGTYGQSHEGDYFAIVNDLDFKNTDFTGIGSARGFLLDFSGSLDGRNHTMHNINFNSGYVPGSDDVKNVKGYLGFVSTVGVNGTVKNLNIASDCKTNFFYYSAPVVGFNKGRVENCRNYADVESYERQAGGVVGINYYGGVISGCYNGGNVTTHFGQAGGIVSYNCDGATVENSQNDGAIIASVPETPLRGASYTILGGITGYNYGSLKNNVNQGVVLADEQAGGIAGNNMAAKGHEIKGNLNTGMVDVRNSVTTRGAIIGTNTVGAAMSGNVHDASIVLFGAVHNSIPTGCSGVSTSALTSGKAIEGLPADIFDYKQGSYPVLKAFANETAAQALRNTYINFADKQVRTNIVGEVALAPDSKIKWELKEHPNFSIAGTTLKVEKPTGLNMAETTLAATYDSKYVKNYVLSSIPEILKGAGTESDPYLVENKTDWNKLADFIAASKWEYSGSYFKMPNDIDFENDSLHVIAHSGVNFCGVFDGAGHTIKGYVYNNSNGFSTRIEGPNFYIGKEIGLFGGLGATGVIKNLTIDGVFTAHGDSGGLVGNVYGRVENCIHKGSFTTYSTSNSAGIAYRVFDQGVISNCQNLGSISAGGAFTAGIVHYVREGGLVEKCYNRGNIDVGAKSYASGIATYVAGTVRDCHNEAPIKAASCVQGIAYTLTGGGVLENCSNKADIELSEGGNVRGIFYTASGASTGKIINCYNTGALSAKSMVFGLGGIVGPGTLVSNCYNTGDIIATSGQACGLVSNLKYDSETGRGSVVENCYNTGNIVAHMYDSAGLVGVADEGTKIIDSYNMGDIYVEVSSTTSQCVAGICASSRALVQRCFNTGNITGNNISSVGGITGFNGTRGTLYGVVRECFNLGDVTVEGTLGNVSHGRAGGISGSSLNDELYYINCYNAGTIRGDQRIAGIVGKVFSAKARVENCYNSGRVILNGLSAGNEMSYTVYAAAQTFANNDVFYKNFENVYYDATVNPGDEVRPVPGSAKTTEQLRDINLGEAFVKSEHNGYPVLKDFGKGHLPTNVSSAMLLVYNPDRENHDKVYNKVTLVGPEDAVWTSLHPDVITVDGTTATPKGTGQAVIQCSDKDGKHTKQFILTVDATQSSIDDLFAGKEVKSVMYIDLSGRQVETPAPGNIYVVRTLYTDGTIQVSKMLVKD